MIHPDRHNQVLDTVYGRMIVNRNAGEFDSLAKLGRSSSHREVETVCALAYCDGPDVLALDVGACFGTFSLALAAILESRGGRVLAFEPQTWLWRCVVGSIALNDLTNAECRNMAVGAVSGICTVPGMDNTKQASFGSVPIREFVNDKSWDIEAPADTSADYQVPLVTLDSLNLSPNLIKIDTEGMELLVLQGAEETIGRSRPVLYVEHIKTDEAALVKWFESHDYVSYVNRSDYVAMPREKRNRYPKIEYEDKVS